MITTILLAIIAISEITRLYLTHRKMTPKRYFEGKLQGTKNMILDLEFKLFKTREIREDVRKEYDGLKSRIHALEEQKKNETVGQENTKKIDEEIATLKDTCLRYEGQMKRLDDEMNGSDEQEGIMTQIDSLQELKGMLSDHIKRL